MITCPACGKENDESAHECRRCRAPLRDDHEAHPAHEAMGEVCRRCEAFNEPGVTICTNCGLPLSHAAAAAPDAPSDQTPPDGSASISSELSALAISDLEAQEAGLSTDKTPPQAFVPPQVETPPPPRQARAPAPVTSSRKVAVPSEPPAAPVVAAHVPVVAAPAEKACANCGAANPPSAKFCFDCGTPFAKKAPAPAPAAEPVPPPAVVAQPPPKSEPPPSIHVDEELVQHLEAEHEATAAPEAAKEPEDDFEISPPRHEPTSEEAPVELSAAGEERDASEELKATSEGDPLPMSLVIDDQPAEIQETDTPGEALVEEVQDELRSESGGEPVPVDAEAVAEAVEALPDAGAALPVTDAEEALPVVGAEEALLVADAGEALPDDAPFPVSLFLDKSGTSFALPYLENSIGSAAGQVELAEDPFVAPRAATITFAGDRLVLRDEGSANGVYVKVRETAPLAAGDSFIAGERLFRFEGAIDLPRDGAGETPLLGSPRPAAASVRVSELLAGGRTGRTCHRTGPVIAIGRSGCDINFPADPLLAARHAEIRLGEDGAASLVDLGQGPSGVLLRVRAEAELQAGDIVQVGEQLLRLELA
jgi:ribosomal protein L40E